jgi:hypothetical protein
MGIRLSSTHWDCECKEHYIHKNSDEVCIICGAVREDSPDSHYDEVGVKEKMFDERIVN